MFQTKTSIAILLWLILGTVFSFQYLSEVFIESQQEEAVSITHRQIQKLTHGFHQLQLEQADIAVYDRGNNPRDIVVYKKIEQACLSIEKIYANNQINISNLKPVLTDSAAFYLSSKYKSPQSTDNQVLKDIYQHSLYQNVYHLLSKEYSRLFYSSCGFFMTDTPLLNASDTTIGFHNVLDASHYVEIPKRDITILNQKYRENIEGVLFFKNNINKPVIFQVNTYTDDGVVSKKYKVKTKKHLQTFDYEEIK